MKNTPYTQITLLILCLSATVLQDIVCAHRATSVSIPSVEISGKTPTAVLKLLDLMLPGRHTPSRGSRSAAGDSPTTALLPRSRERGLPSYHYLPIFLCVFQSMHDDLASPTKIHMLLRTALPTDPVGYGSVSTMAICTWYSGVRGRTHPAASPYHRKHCTVHVITRLDGACRRRHVATATYTRTLGAVFDTIWYSGAVPCRLVPRYWHYRSEYRCHFVIFVWYYLLSCQTSITKTYLCHKTPPVLDNLPFRYHVCSRTHIYMFHDRANPELSISITTLSVMLNRSHPLLYTLYVSSRDVHSSPYLVYVPIMRFRTLWETTMASETPPSVCLHHKVDKIFPVKSDTVSANYLYIYYCCTVHSCYILPPVFNIQCLLYVLQDELEWVPSTSSNTTRPASSTLDMVDAKTSDPPPLYCTDQHVHPSKVCSLLWGVRLDPECEMLIPRLREPTHVYMLIRSRCIPGPPAVASALGGMLIPRLREYIHVYMFIRYRYIPGSSEVTSTLVAIFMLIFYAIVGSLKSCRECTVCKRCIIIFLMYNFKRTFTMLLYFGITSGQQANSSYKYRPCSAACVSNARLYSYPNIPYIVFITALLPPSIRLYDGPKMVLVVEIVIDMFCVPRFTTMLSSFYFILQTGVNPELISTHNSCEPWPIASPVVQACLRGALSNMYSPRTVTPNEQSAVSITTATGSTGHINPAQLSAPYRQHRGMDLVVKIPLSLYMTIYSLAYKYSHLNIAVFLICNHFTTGDMPHVTFIYVIICYDRLGYTCKYFLNGFMRTGYFNSNTRCIEAKTI